MTCGKIATFSADGVVNNEKVPESDAKIMDFINDKVIEGEHDKYDEQYNPHHDFAIFG